MPFLVGGEMEEIKIRIKFDQTLTAGQATLLRGAISSAYPELGLLHNHIGTKYRYSVPLVQYKVIGGNAVILGLKEGADTLKKIAFERESYNLGGKNLHVLERKVIIREVEFGTSNETLHYKFLTPWMALNENNFRRYVKAKPSDQKALLEKIFIGNLIALSKGLGYTVKEQIVVSHAMFLETDVKLKGLPMIGFIGKFDVNFYIPELWGIGKSSSRGFGTTQLIQIKNASL